MARLNEPPVAPAGPNSIAAGVLAATATESVEACKSHLLSTDFISFDPQRQCKLAPGNMRTKSKPILENPPANFEEVKRRFIRQNRELAKNNSQQSLRIRNLELEISKLLSDNLDLRGQVLELQSELFNAQKLATSAAVRSVKDDLRAKIVELAGLVDGLGVTDTEHMMLSVDKERVLSPSRQQYRQRQPLAELMEEAMLPTIVENKTYPRRTLDAEEVRAIRLSNESGTSGSPDLGPPPVAHFDCGDPITFNQSQESVKEPTVSNSPKVIPDEEGLLPSVNLETRRRRKDGQSKLEIRRHSILAHSPVKPEADTATTMLRTGAKRKLADRDTEIQIKPPSKDDFTFSRKLPADHSSLDGDGIPQEQPAEEAVVQGLDEPLSEPLKPARKILSDKSVNMSPRKAAARTDKTLKDHSEKPPPAKTTASKERPPSRGRRVSSIPISAPQEQIVPAFDVPLPEPSLAEQSQPETPAVLDFFSPVMSEPSKTAEGRDTPPPPELSSSSNTTDSGIRPSRRARSAVNYAEPSLVAKMRRPDKQMVDALTGLQDPRRVMNAAKERKSVGPASVPRTASSKKEPREFNDGEEEEEDVDVWATISAREGSPLGSKSSSDPHAEGHGCAPFISTALSASSTASASALSSSSSTNFSSAMSAGRKKREPLDHRRQSRPFSASSSTAVAAAAAAAPPTDSESSLDSTSKKLDEMDLYDFKDSSSPTSCKQASPEPVPPKRGAPRRHSSVAKDATASNSLGSRAGGRRRSMML